MMLPLLAGTGAPGNVAKAVLKCRFPEMTGRRNMETMRVVLSPTLIWFVVAPGLQVVGSLSTEIWNPGLSGPGRAMRISPLLSNRERAAVKSFLSLPLNPPTIEPDVSAAGTRVG